MADLHCCCCKTVIFFRQPDYSYVEASMLGSLGLFRISMQYRALMSSMKSRYLLDRCMTSTKLFLHICPLFLVNIINSSIMLPSQISIPASFIILTCFRLSIYGSAPGSYYDNAYSPYFFTNDEQRIYFAARPQIANEASNSSPDSQSPKASNLRAESKHLASLSAKSTKKVKQIRKYKQDKLFDSQGQLVRGRPWAAPNVALAGENFWVSVIGFKAGFYYFCDMIKYKFISFPIVKETGLYFRFSLLQPLLKAVQKRDKNNQPDSRLRAEPDQFHTSLPSPHALSHFGMNKINIVLAKLNINQSISPPILYKMISRSTLAISLLALAALLYGVSQSGPFSINLQSEKTGPNTLTFTFKSISSILRTTLSRVYTVNDTIFVGDNVGSVGIWAYDAKKKKLDFQDISRSVAAVLPPENKVVHVEADVGGVLVLTADGKLTSYIVNAQSKITGSLPITLDQPSSTFTLAHPTPTPNSTSNSQAPLLLSINQKKTQICLYSLHESIVKPNPITKLQCNTSSSTVSYDHVAFDPLSGLVSTGDENKVVIFRVNGTEFRYVVEANLPKVQAKGSKSVFTNGTLLVVNDLWLNSILIDLTVPSARVISAERTEKIIKSGLTSEISAFFDPKLKKSLTIVNSKDRVQGYTVANSKLTYVNDSKVIGRCESFMLRDQTILFAAVGAELQALKIGDTQEKDYLTVEDEYPIESANHFKPVKSMTLWNNSFVSVSESSKFNFKLWNYSATDYKLTLVDEKSISFFSILKSGYISFLATLMIPPPAKSNIVHIAAVGADPFSLYIVPITAQGKLGTVFRSKDEHSGNVTTIMLSADKKQLITGSMDSTIKIWTLTTNHDQVQDNTTTIPTKNGPIRVGVQDKTGTYYAFGHSSNNFNPLVNISIWKADPKHGLVKLAQNVPGESHQANLTALVLTHDEKYLISLSESGQMRLWRLEGWTMVDLMASLGLGIFDATLQATETNKVLLESEKFFASYYYDQNGFILLGRFMKTFNAPANSSLTVGKTWFSGDMDGSIRIYTYEE